MRTKKLLLTAALVAAGALSSMAQSNVYSLNVVGYVNLTLTNGFQFVANQLDFDGTGTNNTLATVFGTNLPNQTRLYIYSAATAGFTTATYLAANNTWLGNSAGANAALQPGGGVFLSLPATAPVTTVTTVGTVLQGSLSTKFLPGFNIISSQVPVAGGANSLGLTNGISNQDYVYQFVPSTQTYGAKHTFLAGSGAWLGGEPQIGVGEAFWYNAHNTGAWTVTFNVQ